MEEVPFGRYRLREMIGEGGMGQVYEAYDTVTERIVALKVLPAKSADDIEFRERFRREAHAAAGLRDPHVVPIHDFGEIDGRLFLDMRLIEGADVGSLLRRRGPMPPRFAVSIIDQIASALDAAHGERLVHRDVKPSNILVTKKNFAYLIDFGIARAATDTSLTSTGIAIGTVTYMAPERFTSGHADARSDVYALACVLHECLTASRPYAGHSLEQQVAGHLNTPPPRPSRLRQGVPAAFDDVVARGMAKNPDDRFQSAGALAAAAFRALTSLPGPRLPRPTPPPAEEPTVDLRETRTRRPNPTLGVAATEMAPSSAPIRSYSPPPQYAPPLHSTALPNSTALPARRRKGLIAGAFATVLLLAIAVAWWAVSGGDSNESGEDAGSPGQPSAGGPAVDVVATIQVPRTPVAIAIEPGTNSVFSANSDQDTVSVIDTVIRSVTATIPVGKTPVGLALDMDNNRLYTANIGDGTISVVDTASREVVDTLNVGKTTARVALDPATDSLYATNPDNNSVTVYGTDTGTVRASIPVGYFPWSVVVDPDRGDVFVANSHDGTISVIDTESTTVTTTIQLGDDPSRLIVDPTTQLLYATHETTNSVSVIDPTSDSVVATIPAGNSPLGLAIDPQIHTLYVTNLKDGTITVIDTATNAVTTTVPSGGEGPAEMAVDVAGHRLYVDNEYSGTIAVLAPAP
ncbi:serine/threonine-protein kinase [Antrihabitans sp. YC2-6]|uniref:serine/threonine-protein kinase n=1 Tax=Antrihabitans sp. YC2-6 TaxID=2799498 RepID=UPI0018F32EA3|nr:serine/threonine-protein kinase [Antrihabitans sp. YC2-6]MBJ8345298.1 protein kinase [Antrihabitans sp. YC2-6]